MPHRCRRCKEGASLDKPLFACVGCSRHYHSACHRPHPREPTNWVCKRCLAAGHKGLANGHAQGHAKGQAHHRRGYYHDESLPPPSLSQPQPQPPSPSFALPPLAPGLPHDSSRRLTMASLAAAPAAIGLAPPPSPASVPAAPRLPSDTPGLIIRCSFTGCPAKIDGGRQVLCETHLQAIAVTERPRDAVRPNGIHPAPPPKAPTAAPSPRGPPRRSHPLPSLRKLLPDTDKDRPIMRRKTAGHPLQFIPQQPTPKHSTPSSRDGSATSPRSAARPLAPRPASSAPLPGPVHSPPLSPDSQRNGEPARKRQRRSPSPAHSPKAAKANGTAAASRPSTTESDLENKAVGVTSPHSGRHAVNHSPHQRASKADPKPWPKSSLKHPVRKMPLQLSNLRFIDSPDDCVPGILSEQSSSGVNGFAGNFPRRSSWGSIVSTSSDVPLREIRKAKISNPAPSVARNPPAEPIPQPRKPSAEIPIVPYQKPPPERPRPKVQSGYGPFQATGGDPSKQKAHTTIKPAKVIDPEYPPSQKPKEIDTARFDALIYAQSGAASPPPDAALPQLPALSAKRASLKPRKASLPKNEEDDEEDEEEPLYLQIDPRVHYPQPHSATWHAAKQAEIRERGGKKANFGRAARSLQRQRKAMLVAQEEVLPEKIGENPAWVRALRKLGGLDLSSLGSGLDGAGSSVEGGDEEEGVVGRMGRRGVGNGAGNGGSGSVSGGITSKRIGNSGVVVVSGLTGAQFGMMRRGGERGTH